MESFISEIENQSVEEDIIDLEKKIRLFREGKIDEEKFRSLRLARGVYGQRQPGVQMIRIKLPYGKVSSAQLLRISEVSEEYSTGKLHITTRQDIQIHYVSLDRTPELWAELEKDDVTIREACGNTVRNVTASEMAGVDPDEPFDVSSYAEATYRFFLRNPFCQEMGRKVKIAFSSSDKDSALVYMHDIGFIPRIKDGEKGFKVVIGGGLGSQPRHADTVYEFLETNKIIPFIEGVLRVFDREGERSRRLKARLKFLIKEVGLEQFLKWVEEEKNAIQYHEYEIEHVEHSPKQPGQVQKGDILNDDTNFEKWKKSSVIKQKQKGLVAIGIKVRLGDISIDKARKIAALIRDYAGDELRLTLRQNILIRDVPEESVAFFYNELKELGLTETGYNSTADITACPGTDTCNLGIASSTGISRVLEDLLQNEYPHYLENNEILIKISGCMNACGQHMMAHIGFQGMSMQSNKKVAPAAQILLGGGTLGNGEGRFADKVIKVPSKRGPEALRLILNDYEKNVKSGENFLDYYDRQGKIYFYDLLKELADATNLTDDEFIDWGHNKNYIKAIGTGECAGVIIDLVSTLLFETEEKLDFAERAIKDGKFSDSVYYSYAALVNTAKALLTADGQKTNAHSFIINGFDEHFVNTGRFKLDTSFESLALKIKEERPTEAFAKEFFNEAKEFYSLSDKYRKKELENEK